MPKVKIVSEEKKQDTVVRALIKKNMELCSVKPEELAVSVRLGRTSMYSRIRNPSSFTLKELRILMKKLKFTEEEKKLIL